MTTLERLPEKQPESRESGAEIEEKRHAGRPRCEARHQAILAAAYALLEEKGLAKFSIEGVAARAGTAKTTIYRWWPSRGALVVDAFFEALGPILNTEETGDAVADLRARMGGLATALRGRAGRIIADIIAEGQRDPETLHAFVTRYLQPRQQVVRRILERGVAAGQFRPDLNAPAAIDAMFASMVARVMLQDAVPDEAWVAGLADTILHGILAEDARKAA